MSRGGGEDDVFVLYRAFHDTMRHCFHIRTEDSLKTGLPASFQGWQIFSLDYILENGSACKLSVSLPPYTDTYTLHSFTFHLVCFQIDLFLSQNSIHFTCV